MAAARQTPGLSDLYDCPTRGQPNRTSERGAGDLAQRNPQADALPSGSGERAAVAGLSAGYRAGSERPSRSSADAIGHEDARDGKMRRCSTSRSTHPRVRSEKSQGHDVPLGWTLKRISYRSGSHMCLGRGLGGPSPSLGQDKYKRARYPSACAPPRIRRDKSWGRW